MKIVLVAVLIVLLLSGCSHTKLTTSKYSLKSGGIMPISQQGLVVKHAELGFKIKPAQKNLEGEATLTLITTKPREVFSVDLDRVFTISEVRVNDMILDPTQYSNPEGMLLVKQPVSGEFTITIKYRGQPRIPLNPPWDDGLMWETTPSGEPWIATTVQGGGCDIFWPCIDHPTAEPAKVDLHITVPNPLVVASNGVLINVSDEGESRTYHWQTKSMHNTYGIALNIAPYDILEAKFSSIYGNTLDIQFYHLPERTEPAKILFAEIPIMLNFFERMIGPYPFGEEKVGVAETPHLGMEHQTINAYGYGYKKDQYGFDWLLHHEIAHEWFGNQMTNDNWDHIWLHEAFGSYVQPLFAQYLHGDVAYMAYLAQHRNGIINKLPLVSNQVMAMEEVYSKDTGPGPDIYGKGSWVLHTLRYLIGDKAFFSAAKELVYGTPDPQPGNFEPLFRNTGDFLSIVNKITGKDMSWFFDVYIYQSELPRLVVDRGDDSISIAWQIENNKPFPMPVEIQINGVTSTLNLTDSIVFPINNKDVIIVDPASKILKYDQHIVDYQAFKNRDK
jgi:aminopeptidase N